jgi:hypothetical protein
MIFTAQSRMIFGLAGEDADILAHEVASLNFDPYRVKDEQYTRRQLISDHKKMLVNSWTNSEGEAKQWGTTYGDGWFSSDGESAKRYSIDPTLNSSSGKSGSSGGSNGGSKNTSTSHTQGETYLPVYENFKELSSRTYFTFDEQKQIWARDIRRLKVGQALVRLVNDDQLRMVNIKRSTPGHLGFEPHEIAETFPEVLEEMDTMVENNFASDFFVPASTIDRETENRLRRLINGRIVVPATEDDGAELAAPEESAGFGI